MKNLTRRNFLKLASVGTCGALVHEVLEPYSGMMAYALPQTQSLLGDDSVLVIVNLAGGCSYNIAGAYAGAYRDKFPNISYGPPGSTPRASLALSNEQGVHPSLTVFKSEFDLGNLALMNMVGLQGRPDFGHDSASDKWQRGMVNGAPAAGGWMARMTCQLGQAFSGISLAGTDTFTQGDCSPPLSLGDLQNFGESSFWGGNYGTQWLQLRRSSVLSAADPAVSSAERKIVSSTSNLETTLGTMRNYVTAPLPVTFPDTGFGRACRDAARLILARPLGTRIIYIVQSGFDTHSNELATHTNLFNQINGGLNALVQTLKSTNNYDRTVIMTMSEFGRTFENSNRGCDHGFASPMFMLGGRVRGGIHTSAPGPQDMVGNYIANRHCDPREAYYQTVAAMGLDPDRIFPETFSRAGLSLFKA